MQNQIYMKEKPVFPLILSMALPMIISMMVSSLYNIIDSYFVARISEDAMTALSLVFPVQNLAHSVAVGFGIGINAVIAVNLGGGDQKGANQAASLGVAFAGVHGLLLTFICIAVMPSFLASFHVNDTVWQGGIRYSNIVFLFAVAENVGITYEKIFQSVGHMKVSMFSMMCGCIANIILDPLMIFGYGPFPEMGIEGAALATGIGQALSLIIYLIFYLRSPIGVSVEWKSMKWNSGIIRRLYGIGIPAILNLALSSVLITVLNGILAVYSQAYVLILGVYFKLQTFIYLSANGIIQGMRPVIGYNYGAGEKKRVKKIYTTTLVMCASVMLIGFILCLLIPEQLIGLFTENTDTVIHGARALRIISLGFVISAVSVATSGALEGIGKGMPSLVIALLRYIVVIIPVAYIGSRLLQADGVWIAFPVTEVVAAVVSVWLYRRYIRGRVPTVT